VPLGEVNMLRKVLLACGILASLLYIGMNVFVPMLYEGYSYAAHTVSELSAIGAPTRDLWVNLGTIYAFLFAAFGIGVVLAAGQSRFLRMAGAAVILHAVVCFIWPPMHQRGEMFTLTDALHIAATIAALVLMFLAIGLGAAALGRGFRIYSAATILTFLVGGAMTFVDAPRLAANLPTPWIGVWERVNIAAFMFWVIVFAVELLRREAAEARRIPGGDQSAMPLNLPLRPAGGAP
jgi:hypothetical protein